MNEAYPQVLKHKLNRFVRSFGAYKMQVADADEGFHEAVGGCHPRDVMANCNSVIVFAIYVGDEYYRSIKIVNRTDRDYRIMHLFRDWLQFRVAEYLREEGCKSVVRRGFFSEKMLTASLSYKLAAYEAGLGVYGKCGILITPEYGPRVNLGVVLSEITLQPDPKLEKFNPCRGCRVCVDSCPARAVHEDLKPPKSHDRDTCVGFVLRLRKKTGDKDFLCGYCYDNCPIGKMGERGFQPSRYRTLTSLGTHERELLLKETLPTRS